jgi:flagellar basal-body rod protein FlgG
MDAAVTPQRNACRGPLGRFVSLQAIANGVEPPGRQKNERPGRRSGKKLTLAERKPPPASPHARPARPARFEGLAKTLSQNNGGIRTFLTLALRLLVPSRTMDPLTAAAASGLEASMDSFDLLANNLANTSTSGYKADREFYSTYLAPAAANGSDPAVGDSAVVERRWTDFAQGTLLSTGNSTDLGLSGNGFFAVNGPNGPLYTRNGSFHVSPQGALVTAEGYTVRLSGGQALQVQQGAPLEVNSDGQVSQNGNSLGQLELVSFADPSQLSKAAGSYFQNPDPKKDAPATAANLQVAQGKLESSNASPAESAARMVTLLRHFEMLQHAVKLAADMNRQAVEEVAKVGS